ncbi:hypothetical protein SO802_011298, partial [Lithocarpus litseifolius]
PRPRPNPMVRNRLTSQARLARHLLSPGLRSRYLHRLRVPQLLRQVAIRVGLHFTPSHQPPIQLLLPGLPMGRVRNQSEKTRPGAQSVAGHGPFVGGSRVRVESGAGADSIWGSRRMWV